MDSDIYEIYRACRLCGVGAGYKMPIIQSILDLDEDDVELKQKIRECVQIEVNLNDRMPPLICELCVDKIQDFYEFKSLCQETNKKTRTRLCLPIKPLKTNCGPDPPVTESLNSDSDEAEPLSKQVARKPGPKSAKAKAEPVKIKVTDTLLVQMRAALARHLGRARGDSNSGVDAPIVIDESRSPSPEVRRDTRRKRAISPKRVTRRNVTEDTTHTEVQDMPISKTKSKPGPKSAIKARERQKEEEKETTIFDEIEDNLLVPRQKRPREIQVETTFAVKRTKLATEPNKTSKPGPKSSKTTSIPSPVPKPPPKAGPKSKKVDTPPPKSQKPEMPAPKSRKPESQETPKSKKPDLTPSKIEVSKSRSRLEASPVPGPKSRKESLATPIISKIKTRDASSPGPKSKKQPEAPKAPEKTPKAPEKAPKDPEKAPEKVPKASEKVSKASYLTCTICGTKAKAAQGLSSHMKTHIPNYTPPKMACNACELWFATMEAANYHHKRHTNMTLPYTCAKCYDDFRTQDDYEMHFVRAQCIGTYEVPDVKCDDCWKLFPTYKLLEEHRCPGEGGRPGGKCPNCNRSFVSLKGLTSHEIRCSVKKKVEPVTESTESTETDNTSGMLPMQVRVVRCDSLLTPREGCYDVSRLGAKFGLDRNCTYPYLSEDVQPVPATTFNMIDTKDEIKNDYVNQDDNDTFVHWDSNDENDDQTNSVDSLFTISLKAVFSEKCVGKVPRLKRKVKSRKELDLLSMRSNIDLAKESYTDNYDSDSILDKNNERSESVNLFDIKITNLIEYSDPGKEINMVDDDNLIIRNLTENGSNSLNKIQVDANDISDQSARHHQENNEKDARNDLEVTNDNKTTLEEDTRSESSLKHSEDTTNAFENDNNCRSPENSSGIVSDKVVHELSIPNEEIDEAKEQGELENTYKIQESNREITNKLNDFNDIQMSEQTTEETTVSKNESKFISNTDSQVYETSTSNDDVNDTKYESIQERDDKINEDCDPSCANGDTFTATNDARNEKDTPNANENAYEADLYTATNYKEDDDSSDVKYELTKHDNPTNGDERNNYNEPCGIISDSNERDLNNATNDKINKNDDSSAPEYATVNNANPENNSEDISKTREVTKNIEFDSKESLISENELFDNISVQSVDKFNINYLDDEDKLLMAELDAQIGENTSPSNETGEKINEIGDNSEIIDGSNEMIYKNIEGMDGNSEIIDENSELISNNSAIIGDDPVIGENSAIIADNAIIGAPSAIIDDVLVTDPDADNDFKTETIITNEGFTEEKNEALEILINKHNDFKSLDLDTVSDEEFDFDL